MNKTVFLDRDGLINKKAPEHEYICKFEDFEFLPGVKDAVSRLTKAGFTVIVITNQRGIARNKVTRAQVDEIHRLMCEALDAVGAHISAVYVCPHNIGECRCRKPDIGMFLMAENDFEIDKTNSWMVGDSISDVEAGRNYGVRTILTDDLSRAAEIILSDNLTETTL